MTGRANCPSSGMRERAGTSPCMTSVREGSAKHRTQRTGFDDRAPRANVEPRRDERDVCNVQDLRAVRECARPELGRWAEDVDEATAVATRDLGAEGDPDELRVAVVPEAAVELRAGRDDNREQLLARLGGERMSAAGVRGSRGRTIQTMIVSPAAISRAEDHMLGLQPERSSVVKLDGTGRGGSRRKVRRDPGKYISPPGSTAAVSRRQVFPHRHWWSARRLLYGTRLLHVSYTARRPPVAVVHRREDRHDCADSSGLCPQSCC
jgi:hypothetical protein